jgi:hypothetical protein
MRNTIIKIALAAGLAVCAAAPASAAVTLSAQAGSSTYFGPTPTFDFEIPAPVDGGLVTTGSLSGVRAQPLGSIGKYLTVGPTDGTPATLNLAAFGAIGSISFIWGSVDTYNVLEFLSGNTVLHTFTGSNVTVPANGNQVAAQSNPLVTFTLTGDDRFAVDGLRFNSSVNAFELDNVTIGAVPEPSTWAMLIGGFGLVGYTLRRRRREPRHALA